MKFQTKKILIFFIICDLLVCVGYFFLYNLVKKESENASTLISNIDSGEQKNSKLRALRSVIKDTQVQRDQIATFFISPDSEVSFIEQVEKLAASSKLTTKTNSVSSVAGQTSTTKVLEIQEQVSGSWSNVMYFLSKLENLPYDIHIQNLSLNRSGGTVWSGAFDIIVTENK